MKKEEKLKRIVVSLCFLATASTLMATVYESTVLIFFTFGFLCILVAFVAQLFRMKANA